MGIALPWPRARGKTAKYGERRVNRVSSRGRKVRWRKAKGMDSPWIPDRQSLDDAHLLMREHGDDAGFEASIRAQQSRNDGNVIKFCHWRQIERLIASLASDAVSGSIH